MIIDIDNVKISNRHSDYNNLTKFLQTFRKISEIHINISFPANAQQTNYFMPYFNLIKNITQRPRRPIMERLSREQGTPETGFSYL